MTASTARSQPPAAAPQDVLTRGLAAGGQVRAIAARTTALTEEARRRHGLSPTATAALGRALTAVAMMGALLKGDERVMLQILGEGPLGHVVAEGDARGRVRGYVSHPDAHLPLNENGKLDVGGAVGGGQLVVIRDLGLREPYRGAVPLVSGEIAEDLAHYFTRSEQIPSAVALGVLVGADGQVLAAGGLLLQLMPGHTEELADVLTTRLSTVPPVTQLVQQGLTPAELLQKVLQDLGLDVLAEYPLTFACSCSKDRLAKALIALGKSELDELAGQPEGAELICRFCSTRYTFSPAELRQLRDSARQL